jgi:hypothetical protein
MPITRLMTALLLLIATAGCSDDPVIPDPPPSMAASGSHRTGPIAGCDDAIDRVAEPGDGYRMIGGVVAAPDSNRMLEPAEQTSGEGPTRLFAKWGLLVHADATVDLSLLPGWEGRARLNWGGAGFEPATSVRIVSCGTDPDAGRWVVFAGGVWVAEPDCVPIRISTATEQVIAEFSVGTPCSRPGG